MHSAALEYISRHLFSLYFSRISITFKQRFYRRPWAHYELAKLGTFGLGPAEHVLAAVEKDYAQMRNMIFGRYPSFGEIMESLRKLAAEINELYRRQ
ncbi:MAG: hypothetical protein HY016_05200 [Nitrosomonadales bacterium]|nr:hypothetical protein [Nitrosomonadales bacterium]